MSILITGGGGYIGSHTAVELLNAGLEVVIVDSLTNSNAGVIAGIEKITKKRPVFYDADACDKAALSKIFARGGISGVIHFAGHKAVGESVSDPIKYYRNNIGSTLSLLECMRSHGVYNLVFSSSATVYGNPSSVPIREDFPLNPTNPYGRTKLFIEQILRDVYASDGKMNIALLRYFNPIGAHESGLIGEQPSGTPNNLAPYIMQVAAGKLPYLQVFGNDYPTPDGTGIRDYLHVVDLARGHLAALEKLKTNCGVVTYNLGTGRGCSVLELLKVFSKAVGFDIPYKIAPRRAGDIAECYADPTLARRELGWEASRTLEQMARDSWNWQKNAPTVK